MSTSQSDRIRPFEANPAYFQYKGQPVLLLGGSVEDNLFQIPRLESHLDLLCSVGGNYVRCTMSSRDEGNVWPYTRDSATGLYDLYAWDEEYWTRFSRFLEATAARGIIVQVEVWATWDFYTNVDAWLRNAYNPKNTSTYTAEKCGLPQAWDYLAPARINPFFETIPELSDNQLVLTIQKRFVDKVLSYTLDYDHVLYCMNNETNADPRWGLYWNRHIKQAAAARGVRIETTDMFDNWDPSDGRVPGAMIQSLEDHPHLHRSNAQFTIAHPEEYSFVDISNHNAQRGQVHYDTALYIRNQIAASSSVRPITCDKMYGGDLDAEWAGSRRDGQERLWRNLFAGVAACRFHRPPAGLGLNELAQAHLKSARMLTDALGIFTCEPHNELLDGHRDNGAFCLAYPGKAAAVVCFDGNEVVLDCSAMRGDVSVRWLDIMSSTWLEPAAPVTPGPVALKPPSDSFCAVLITGTD